MASESLRIRLLLDEHYPGWLADSLRAEGIVTEDVTTFGAAIRLVPSHVGVIYCHHARFPRTRTGLEKLRKALIAVAGDPPQGLGLAPIVWWLAD
jgi:hypothetical protein